jgi:hypothetical protein
LVSATNAVE